MKKSTKIRNDGQIESQAKANNGERWAEPKRTTRKNIKQKSEENKRERTTNEENPLQK